MDLAAPRDQSPYLIELLGVKTISRTGLRRIRFHPRDQSVDFLFRAHPVFKLVTWLEAAMFGAEIRRLCDQGLTMCALEPRISKT